MTMTIQTYGSLVGRLLEDFRETGLDPANYFQWAIHKQNTIYELPINLYPTLSEEDLGESPLKRIQGFMKTLEKEMHEGREIEFALEEFESYKNGTTPSLNEVKARAAAKNLGGKRAHDLSNLLVTAWANGLEEVQNQILVMIADWLGDINVYLRSEALKFGLPHEAVLNVIMGSNFTKLAEDGTPIKDENGKFLKGPNYIAPEEHIYATLFNMDVLSEDRDAIQEQAQHAQEVLDLTGNDGPMTQVILATFAEGEEEYASEDEDEGYSIYTDTEGGSLKEVSDFAHPMLQVTDQDTLDSPKPAGGD